MTIDLKGAHPAAASHPTTPAAAPAPAARPASAARLRVVLVDDHELLRTGLKELLAADSNIEVVGQAGTAAEALNVIEVSDPGLIVTDIALPDRSGLELLAEVRARGMLAPIMILTVHKNAEYVRSALEAGASGYMLKDATHDELLRGIRAVAAGRTYVCEAVIGNLLSLVDSETPGEPGRSLGSLITPREREVLARVALGQSNKAAARGLGLSVKTVEKHRSNLMRKLQLHNTAALTMFAIRFGLVSKDDGPAA